MRTLITDCRIVSAGLDINSGAILIENDKISALYTKGDTLPNADKVIKGDGLIAMPGFIDTHCHGRNNADFCDGSVDGVNTIARGKLEEGVTSLLPTTLTLPETELSAALEAIAQHDQKGCKLPGVHLEGPFINVHCLGAQNPDYVQLPDVSLVKRLNAIYPVRKVSFAAELEGADKLTAELCSMGIVPSCVHSAANYAQFERCYTQGMRNLSHFCNQMTPLHHRDVGLVGAGLLKNDVYSELICDKLHICPEMIALTFKVKGSEHVVLITDAMRAAGMPDGEYSLGGLPVISRDGAARLKNGGALAGSVLKLNVALKNIVEITQLPLSELVKSLTRTPALALGLANIGELTPGYQADIVLLDTDFAVQKTIVDGAIRFER
ncbi:MAG: N-acetylglucosamine-6-phosphate deacetylase [Victivallales bacterium]|jgi:N-acetylglucosamine-6-phosphate deacetylase|nr:N-acetylglucosamine-6-phosphate deacetylase [Victivallales bacterium]